MKREDIKALVDERLGAVGCPTSNRHVSIVPSKVKIEIAVGGQRLSFECRAGATRQEVEYAIGQLEKRYLDCKDQVDIEEAINAALPAI